MLSRNMFVWESVKKGSIILSFIKERVLVPKWHIRMDIKYLHIFSLFFAISCDLFNPNPRGILARNLPESSKILQCTFGNMPLIFKMHWSCIFVDLSYLALLAFASCQVVILSHLKRWKYQFPTVLVFFPKRCPLVLEDFRGFGVVRDGYMYMYMYMYIHVHTSMLIQRE